ncbi:MAG: lytic transglycosylase domain-containing protein [Chromatiaceae bacterium]|jgi:soluble lytic murein transglycosylase-like protein|nr:lytic transglycosylase domain-containing protein [Candidatus Thioaporhodococcus sediminis]
MRGLILLLMGLPFMAAADIYKYVDAEGKIYFTDAPLQGANLTLEWKREANKVAASSGKVLAIGRSRPLAEPPPPAELSARRARYERIIDLIAGQENLYPELLHAVVRAESAYNPGAVSPAGATGLMQLMPATAARYRVAEIEDPTENLRGGARYLRDLLDMFGNDLQLALAAYNAGENAVVQYGNRIPPYPETQRYVRKVMQFLWAERTSAKRE